MVVGLCSTMTCFSSLMVCSTVLVARNVWVQTAITMVLIGVCSSFAFYILGSHLGQLFIRRTLASEEPLLKTEDEDSNQSVVFFGSSLLKQKISHRSTVEGIHPPRKTQQLHFFSFFLVFYVSCLKLHQREKFPSNFFCLLGSFLG